MKAAFVIALSLVSVATHASEWITYHQDDDAVMSLDGESLKKTGRDVWVYWTRSEFNSVRGSDIQYDMTKTYKKINCGNGTHQSLYTVVYLNGNVVQRVGEQVPRIIVPDSVLSTLTDRMCAKRRK